MADRPDGTVIISTKIDETGLEQGFKELSDILKDIKKSIDTFGKEITTALSKISVVSVTKEFEEMDKSVNKSTKNTKKSIQELELELKELDKAQAELESSLIPEGLENVATDEQIQDILKQSKAWQKLKTDIEKVELQLSTLKAKQETVDIAPMDVSVDPKEKTDLIDLENAIDDVGDASKKTDEELKPLPDAIDEVGDQAEKTSTRISGLGSVLKGTVSILNKFGLSLLKIVGSGVLKGAKSIGGLAKSFDGLTKSMGRSVKMMGTIIIYSALFSALSKITEVTREVLLYNNQFVDSLAQIKGNLMTAFMPIYNAVMPAINALMQSLVTLTGYLAQFTNTLFGTSIKASQNQAKAMYDQAFATEKATKAQKGLNNQLAKYDELNVIQKVSTPDATTPKADEPVTPTFDAIETTKQVEKILEMLDMVKKAWQDADFTMIGFSIGQALTNSLEDIDWNKIQSTADRIAKSFATLGNGIMLGTDWETVGKTVAEGLNTITTTISTFIKTFDWEELGISFGESINGLFDFIDWDNISDIVSDGINGITDTLRGINETIDFAQIGSDIAKSINKMFTDIDWSETAKQLSTGLINIITTIDTFLKTVDWEKIGKSIVDFIAGIDWLGLFVAFAKTLFDIIVASFELTDSISQEIANKISQPIVDAITKINDYFTDLGTKIGEFLLKAFNSEKFKKVATTALNALTNPFGTIQDIFKKIGEKAINGLKGTFAWKVISDHITSFVNSLKKKFENAKTWFSDIGSKMISGLKERFKWGNIVDHFNSFITSLKNKFNGIKSFFTTLGTSMITNLKNAFKYDKIKDAIVKPFVNAANAIISIFNNMIKAINKALKISWGDIKVAGQTIIDKGSVTIAKIPEIPKLAQGTYIPPNFGEFMAILGDNKTQAEYVTPEDKLLNAFNKALDSRDGQEINLYVDGEKWFNWMIKKGRKYKNQTGRTAF